MAYKRVKRMDLWGPYHETVWYEGPNDYVALVARTSQAAVVTFKRDDTPTRLREWLFREIFKVADAKGISFERRGDRLHAPLAQLEEVYWLVRKISKHAQLSEGAKAYLAELEAAEKEAQRSGPFGY
ncbi:MAG: hypothetical protein ACYSUC_11730 [Planctomycetota bacterium]|jgi:hypothetical protein